MRNLAFRDINERRSRIESGNAAPALSSQAAKHARATTHIEQVASLSNTRLGQHFLVKWKNTCFLYLGPILCPSTPKLTLNRRRPRCAPSFGSHTLPHPHGRGSNTPIASSIVTSLMREDRPA